MDKHEHPEFTLINGDCVKAIVEIPENSVDLQVFSPPFASLYTYSSHIEDMGNSRDSDAEFLLHYNFLAPELTRILKPGHICAMHIADVPRLKEAHGYIGAYDLMGDLIRIHEKHGLHFVRRWTVNKNPQAQSILHHSSTLTFTQFEKDSRESAAALADYVVIFKKPGKLPDYVPVVPEATREEWIEWANPTWYGHHETVKCPNCKQVIIQGISQTDTLNKECVRTEKDEIHLCPLQLPLIDRIVRLYTNKGETVFTPFLGIGSEVYQSVLRHRKGIGIELKKEYYDQAIVNCLRAVKERDEQQEMFILK